MRLPEHTSALLPSSTVTLPDKTGRIYCASQPLISQLIVDRTKLAVEFCSLLILDIVAFFSVNHRDASIEYRQICGRAV